MTYPLFKKSHKIPLSVCMSLLLLLQACTSMVQLSLGGEDPPERPNAEDIRGVTLVSGESIEIDLSARWWTKWISPDSLECRANGRRLHLATTDIATIDVEQIDKTRTTLLKVAAVLVVVGFMIDGLNRSHWDLGFTPPSD